MGTFLLFVLGAGVVARVLLNKTFGQNSGYIVITWGWGIGVFGIGMSLGGTTGYAINPARDLGPRIAHMLLPIKGKGGSDWRYAWIPVVAPLAGAVIAALVYRWLPF